MNIKRLQYLIVVMVVSLSASLFVSKSTYAGVHDNLPSRCKSNVIKYSNKYATYKKRVYKWIKTCLNKKRAGKLVHKNESLKHVWRKGIKRGYSKKRLHVYYNGENKVDKVLFTFNAPLGFNVPPKRTKKADKNKKNRCKSKVLKISNTYPDYHFRTFQWIKTCVKKNRAADLVANNKSLQLTWQNAKEKKYKSRRLYARYKKSANRVESIMFYIKIPKSKKSTKQKSEETPEFEPSKEDLRFLMR